MAKRPRLQRCVLALVAAALAAGPGGHRAEAAEADAAAPPAAKKGAPAPKDGKASSAAAPKTAKHWDPAELGGTREPYAEVTRVPTGKPVVAIHYPWRVHSRPSVEVRWLADDEPDTTEIRPLQFVASLMKGEITSAVYDVRDKAADTAVAKTLKIHDRPCEILGDRNSLGKPAAMIVFPEQAKDAPDRAARVVFFPLDGWALDRTTLRLELPAAHFSAPGRIRVWFYREGNVVWWKTLAWPGAK